jgi:hypothetical protein
LCEDKGDFRKQLRKGRKTLSCDKPSWIEGLTEIDNGGTPDFTGTFVRGEKDTYSFSDASTDMPKKKATEFSSLTPWNIWNRCKESHLDYSALVLGSSKKSFDF